MDDAVVVDIHDSSTLSMIEKYSPAPPPKPDPPSYGTFCIYKVTEKLRSKNPEAYTPRLVSIGFVHHGADHLRAMQKQKARYLNHFLSTFRVDLPELARFVDAQKDLVCDCYGRDCVSSLSDITQSEVILLDGVFVVELFLKTRFLKLRDEGDMIFSSPDHDQVSREILHDLLLFENQIPLKFLHKLYDEFVASKWGQMQWLVDGTSSIDPPSFYELSHEYFKDVASTQLFLSPDDFLLARHFVEASSFRHKPVLEGKLGYEYYRNNRMKSRGFGFADYPTATELRAAGVVFEKRDEKSCLLDFDFDYKSGVLKIPQLIVNDLTETFFRNQLAFEQSILFPSKYVTSTLILLRILIYTTEDVDCLIYHEIIKNELGTRKQVADLFNNLFKEFSTEREDLVLSLSECLPRQQRYMIRILYTTCNYRRTMYHKISAETATWFVLRRRWFVVLRETYFGNPWSIVSLIAATMILGLTAIQAAYSIKSAT